MILEDNWQETGEDFFKGIVECYENDNPDPKWIRKNKITFAGRAALLKIITNSPKMIISSSNDFRSGLAEGHIDRNSFLSVFAVGNGGHTSDTIIPNAPKFTDIMMNSIVPLTYRTRQWSTKDKYTFVYATEEQMELAYNNTETSSKVIDYYGNVYNPENVYFRRVEAVSNVNQTKLSISLGDTTAKYFSALSTLSLKISGEYLRNEENYRKINEIGLFLAPIKLSSLSNGSCQDGSDEANNKYVKGSDATFISTEDPNCSRFSDGSIPIMFSHLTFPMEEFIGSEEKVLTFKYTIYV
jgi:hypothetical protein